jgi:hypothetical protein
MCLIVLGKSTGRFYVMDWIYPPVIQYMDMYAIILFESEFSIWELR